MRRTALALFFLFLLPPFFVRAQNAGDVAKDIKTWELKTAQYKDWLDQLQGGTYKFWTRLDGAGRPHKLYVGEGFNQAGFKDQEQFVEIFSHYLAGHPDKFMLIDLYDATTGAPVGEYGWAGFKLFDPQPRAEKTQATISQKPAGK